MALRFTNFYGGPEHKNICGPNSSAGNISKREIVAELLRKFIRYKVSKRHFAERFRPDLTMRPRSTAEQSNQLSIMKSFKKSFVHGFMGRPIDINLWQKRVILLTPKDARATVGPSLWVDFYDATGTPTQIGFIVLVNGSIPCRFTLEAWSICVRPRYPLG